MHASQEQSRESRIGMQEERVATDLTLVSLVSHSVLYSRRRHGGFHCHSSDPLGVPADDGTSGPFSLDRHLQAARVFAELPGQLYR